MTKGERNRHFLIEEMERLYLDRAWSDQEMSERLGTDRTNVWKIRTKEMEEKMGIPFLEDSRGRYRIDQAHYPANIRLKPAEALVLYLGGRRLQQHTKTGQQDVASALEKLAAALHKPFVGKMVRAAEVVLEQEQDLQQSKNLRVLMEAWVNGRCVRIKHRKPHGELRTYTVRPYQLEPSVWGDGVYLIGYSDYHNGIASFKLSRIEHITQTTQPFTTPNTFDSHEMLRYAWGIWHSDEKPERVRLQFSRYVRPYVQETIWHPEQTIQTLPDGGCIWEAEIAEWREMLPWVRGWGADVVVLEPDEMKEAVKSHITRAANKYNLSVGNIDPNARLQHLWGKTTKNANVYHPALYHMLDVAHVAQQLLSPRATPRWRQVLAQMLGTEVGALHEWLPWFVVIHDIGKISIPFQAQNEQQRQRLEAEKFDFGRYTNEHKQLHHTIVGRRTLEEWVRQYPRRWQTVFLEMVSGHHGEYQAMETKEKGLWSTIQEPEEWANLRQQAIQLLQHSLLLNEPAAWPEPKNISAAIVALNGFTILCDWLGSDEDYFTPRPFTPLLEYLSHSRQQARARVAEAGFFVPAVSSALTSFSGLFQWQPRPLQQAIDNIPQYLLSASSLTIIEAPTGEGKTEAALTLAHRIGQVRGTDELYVALPTTATSNAMYGRLQEHLEIRLGLPANLVKLIHGQDFLVEDDLRITPLENNDGEPHPALTWFAPKKKALLAPFGVGTIDQVELAALNVRHNALRLIGLAGKVVILDEVHAYDTYMNTIIERMLCWLAELGTSVILLSATLPTARKHSLIAAYMCEDEPVRLEKSQAYPYLLTVNDLGYSEASPPEQAARRVHLHALHFDEEDWVSKAGWLVEQVSEGGCVCWITNTVERAQCIFQQVRVLAPDDVDCTLFHARFPLEERHRIEGEILAKFGKGENRRPSKSIVVGTQVLEQSLDIDFDLMVSDLAPIDLLLQRIGRLHRHQRSNRAAAFFEAHIYINCALDEAGQLLMGADRFYMPFILHKSWEQIAEKVGASGVMDLPEDYRPLIEAVYDETPPAEDSALFELWEERQKRESKLENEAAIRLAEEPDPIRPFWMNDEKLFREDEDSNDWTVAQTRYQDRKTITVIPLEKVGEEVGRLYPTSETVPLNQAADRPTQLRLSQRSVRLSHPAIVLALRQEPENRPALFTDSPLLKRCYPLWLVDGFIQIEDIQVYLDLELGILIQK